VFTLLREQVCTTICPYGRLQSVLLDENSLVVAYDHKRGEGRSKFKKNEDRAANGKGDCIDCYQCVNVCPTGIDIRNGTQLECVNCTACIDACDHMMDNVGLERGLIGFLSEKGITTGVKFQWTRRVISYTILLISMLVVLTILLLTRKDFETTILRQRGSTYQITNDGQISNIFEINLTNKTQNDYEVTLKLDHSDAEIDLVVDDLILKAENYLKERFVMKLPINKVTNGKEDITIIVYGNGKEIDRVKTKFIGPNI
jgi:cytochrome c oxidase accessory protein FixG